MCCHPKKAIDLTLKSSEKSQIIKSISEWEVIGEGTNFLTVKIDYPKNLSSAFQVYALILDKDKSPLRNVSGYSSNPQLEGKNHLWFYFFLYAPGQSLPFFLSDSRNIKFVWVIGGDVVLESVVEHHKTWGSKGKPEIFDLPSPPDQIPGYLVLKDYTFLAKGDFRKPEGYYVEGEITGSSGEWSHFIALSDIQGDEPEPDYILLTSQGWLELETGKTHSMQEAIAPSPPYVQGWWDGKGYFHPNPAKVYGLKLGPK